MKKIIFIISFVIFILFIGCSPENQDYNSSEEVSIKSQDVDAVNTSYQKSAKLKILLMFVVEDPERVDKIINDIDNIRTIFKNNNQHRDSLVLDEFKKEDPDFRVINNLTGEAHIRKNLDDIYPYIESIIDTFTEEERKKIISKMEMLKEFLKKQKNNEQRRPPITEKVKSLLNKLKLSDKQQEEINQLVTDIRNEIKETVAQFSKENDIQELKILFIEAKISKEFILGRLEDFKNKNVLNILVNYLQRLHSILNAEQREILVNEIQNVFLKL